MKFRLLTSVLLVLAIISTIVVPSCTCRVEAAESYMAVIPRVLQSDSTETLSISLFSEGKPVKDNIEISLLDDGQEIKKISKTVTGKGLIEMDIPDVEEGKYEIRVKGSGFDEKAEVQIENNFLVFLETDKPIYKPGQTIHIRAITLNAELKPVQETMTIEVLDAKGIKIFRREISTVDYGLITLDLPISNEPNLGVWKLTAVTEKAKTQLDIRVEEYVLPKYEVVAELPKEWFLVDEEITGVIAAEYSFGKPVKGELEIIASRYVGVWEEFATFTKSIDGETEFVIEPVGYVAGVPEAGGLGNVMLDITVTEQSTGYVEKTSELLTVTSTPVNIQIIPESRVFKPGLPLSMLIVSETPDNKPVDTDIRIEVSYLDDEYSQITTDTKEVKTDKGKVIIEITPPEKAVALTIDCYELTSQRNATAHLEMEASYSPSGNFIHVEQTSEGIPEIGEDVTFKVYSTKQAVNFYYEVVSRGRVVFSDYTNDDDIRIKTTPMMSPSSRLLVYQILPNSEVAADYLPFDVVAEYPHTVKAEFSTEQASPGDMVDINIDTEGVSLVGIAAVDKSVFILAENRLNLQQVFDELERLYMMPQVELHEVSIYPSIETRGAKDVFDEAGVIVLSNKDIPDGKKYEMERLAGGKGGIFMGVEDAVQVEREEMAPPPEPIVVQPTKSGANGELAEVERVRQFFPETWLWEVIPTNSSGKASLEVEVPDTITTWMLRAVALSNEKGMGVAEDQLVAFQPFFVSVDLPYSAIRGEEFPVSVAVYNYLDSQQEVFVEIEESDWFELLDTSEKTVVVEAGEVGGVDFMIRTKKLGINKVKITARSKESADAVIKTVIVEPEGVSREEVENLIFSADISHEIDTSVPFNIVQDSGRAYITFTSSYLTQTIDGLEGLIQMPFGCGEQNMIVFAPDVFITKYLRESGQLKPEIMAKAEKLMITGYQRELTYRHNDGSFSAFGESDQEGSLWLTAFVLKSFAQAQDLMYIDQDVLDEAADWITSHQNSDGSFDPVGFVHHQEMLGGLQGKNALTAYVTVALLEAGEKSATDKAVSYLENELNEMEDVYTLAITAYTLELAESARAGEAYAMLMEKAIEDENGIHWGSSGDDPQPLKGEEIERRHMIQNTAEIETTGYAMMALTKHGDAFNASRAAKWLVSQRNAYGGYGSTQDTVVALQALTEYSSGTRSDVDLEVSIETTGIVKQIKINQENFDVLQVVEVPVNENINLSVSGKGEAIAQVVKRYNMPETGAAEEILKVDVNYDATQVEVNDLVKVSASVEFNPPEFMEAGMVVLDVSIPTGFVPVTDSIIEVVEDDENIKRYEVAGRKVIFYIENMMPGDRIAFSFYVMAQYPVKAKAVTSQAYSYYKPEIRGETLGKDMVVSDN
ncbi:MAG TPA: alpha-2-macroglobulin [Dehalococcoidia bacterium]|nr:alpha-2-macroglobulin [Dehalococcoidia bacterium]